LSALAATERGAYDFYSLRTWATCLLGVAELENTAHRVVEHSRRGRQAGQVSEDVSHEPCSRGDKGDLLPYLPFSVEAAVADMLAIQPRLQHFVISAITGDGIDKWCEFVSNARRNSRRTADSLTPKTQSTQCRPCVWESLEKSFAGSIDRFRSRTRKSSADGWRRLCSMACVPEADEGDYVIVYAGIAIGKIDAVEAERVFAELNRLGDDEGGTLAFG
jgi:hydrogenase maturation factor